MLLNIEVGLVVGNEGSSQGHIGFLIIVAAIVRG